jgi:hypothetical protein
MLEVDLKKKELRLKYLNFLKASLDFEFMSKKSGASNSSRIAIRYDKGRLSLYFMAGLASAEIIYFRLCSVDKSVYVLLASKAGVLVFSGFIKAQGLRD